MTDTSTAHVRHAVRNARDGLGMTQNELASRAGVSRQWLAGFESGRMANPRWASIVSVLDELGLSLTTVRVDQAATPAEAAVAGVAPTAKDERAADDGVVLASVLARTRGAVRPESLAMGQDARNVDRSLASSFEASPGMKAAGDAISSIESLYKRDPALKAALDAVTSVSASYQDSPALKAALDASSSLRSIGERSSAVKAAQDQARQVAALLNTPGMQSVLEAARRAGRP